VPGHLESETLRIIPLYQEVRQFATLVRERVSMTFGATTKCVLPMLYALLGACAYLIRLFERQLRTHTFTGHDRPAARFLTAAICGVVVGLFGDFGGSQGAILPPLGIAFLVGFAADVFFNFLDGLVQALGRSRETATDDSRAASTIAPAPLARQAR